MAEHETRDEQMQVDKDDLNYLRVLTSICEVDTKRFEDVMLIGGTPRIIQVFCLCLCVCQEAEAINPTSDRRRSIDYADTPRTPGHAQDALTR